MTKAELKEWAPLCEEWDDLCRKIRELESKAVSGRSKVRTEAALQRFRALRDGVNSEIVKIEAAVDSLPSVERRLIVLRYCEGLSWRKIAVDLGFSVDHVGGALHRRALKLLAGL